MKKTAKHDKEVNSNLSLLFKTSIAVFLMVALSKIFSYAYRLIVARYFGPEVYGLLSIGLMVVGLFVAVSSIGLSDGILRFISIYRGKNENRKIFTIYNISLVFLSVTGIISFVIVFLAAEYIATGIFHNENLTIYLKLFSILIPISMFANLYLAVIRAFERIEAFSFIFNIVQNLIKLILLGLFLFVGINYISVPISHLLGILAMLAVSYYYCRKKLPALFLGKINDKKEQISIKKELFAYSSPIMFYAIISTIFVWVDTFFIGYFQDAFQVGLYNAAIPIATLLGFAPEIFTQLFLPLISKEYAKKNKKLIEELSKQVAKWIFIINLPVLALITIFPGVFLNVLFGPEFLPAEQALRWLAIGIFVYNAAHIISSNLLSMGGRSKVILANTIISGVLNVILNIILIPKYGITGAAIATTISLIVLSILSISQVYHYFKIVPLRRKMIRIIFVVIIPVALLLIFRLYVPINMFSLIFAGLLFGIIYVFLLFATQCLDRNDLMIVQKIKDKFSLKK